jgi:hypothetical protein
MKGKKEFEIERGFTLRILLRALRVVVAALWRSKSLQAIL